jgi:acyl-coenzyme A thioesterase PaaI-like protein
MATLDFRIDYMRPARPRAGVTGQAHCYRLTRSVAFVRGIAFDEDPNDPIATVQAAFALNQPSFAKASEGAPRGDLSSEAQKGA